MPNPKPAKRPPDQPGEPRRPAPLGDTARDAAVRTLARQARLFPDFDPHAMDHAEARADLSPIDLALAHAIHDAAVRRFLTIRFLLQACLTQPFDELEARVRGVLLAGAAQLVLLDRVPAHAAINHAVEWAKVVVRPGAGALVNAVLRKVAQLASEDAPRAAEPPHEAVAGGRADLPRDRLPLGDGAWRVLAAPILPEDASERLSISASLPRWLIDRWTARLGAPVARELALHALAEPPVVLNTAHAAAPVRGTGPHEEPGRGVFEGSRHELVALLRSRADVWVQDAASAGAVESIADLRPGLIIDLCAGRGTKTRQLAAVFPSARICATDADERRLDALRSVFKGHERVSVAGVRSTLRANVGKADLVLLDVPCSNTGVLARRPEARYRADEAHLRSLVDVQRQIVADSIPLLTEGGRILYSTCSIEPEENHAMAEWAAKWHGFVPRRERIQLPRGLPGGAASLYRDGGYSVLLERG